MLVDSQLLLVKELEQREHQLTVVNLQLVESQEYRENPQQVLLPPTPSLAMEIAQSLGLSPPEK